MMKAKVTRSFPGVPDGAAHPINFADGDVVTGDLAVVAVREKWADPIAEESAPAAPKASKGRGSRKRSGA